MKRIEVKNIEKTGRDVKTERKSAFVRMFDATKNAILPLACATALALNTSACGDVETQVGRDGGSADVAVLEDVSRAWDGGQSKDDSKTETDAQRCQFERYVVLEIDGKRKVVAYGDKVIVGNKFYTVKDTENDGPILQYKDEIYIIGTDTPVNGKTVSYLGEGTRQTDSVLLQIEYGDNAVPKDFRSVLKKGSSDKIWVVDGEQYVQPTLYDVIRTDKGLEYAVFSVKMFVKSTEGNNTYIASKTLENVVVPIDEAVSVVLDEPTGLVINLDALATGTSEGKMVLKVNGEEVKLGAGDVYEVKVGWTKVELKGKSVLHSPDSPSGSVQIAIPNNNEVVLGALMKGEVKRIDLGEDGMLRVELVGSESDCDVPSYK